METRGKRGPMRLKSVQDAWDELGRKDPFWAVLTAPEKRGNRWEAAEFFQTGAETVAALMRYLDSLGLAFGRRAALDFGCGVGRLTQPLASYFDRVCGVDIAPSMIELARRHNRCGERCRFLVNQAEDLSLFADESFDFACSLLTLQHMPAEYGKRYLRELVRVLVPGGVLLFQTAGQPTAAPSGVWHRMRRVLRRLAPEAVVRAYRKARYGHLIEMHGIRKEEVVALLEEEGARVADVVEDTSAGGGWTSFRYCAQKAGGGER